ncbi:MAG: glycosyltransferase, partial [Candidatus Omnitrophica bacterium]|nr:glycosyltransferase [Candidatus Omnitrophota bacterium]
KEKIKHKTQQLGLENIIIRMDFQENIEMILNQLDILVNASHNEGFSRIIIEAMSLKKAVVATDVGGNAEAVEEGRTGFLVPPRNSTALASAILQLVEDLPLRNSFGCAGQEKVLKEFLLEKMVKRVEKVYEEVINS